MRTLGLAVNAILGNYKWKQVAIVRSSSQDCDTALSGIYSVIKNPLTQVRLKAELTADTDREIIQALMTLKTVARSEWYETCVF